MFLIPEKKDLSGRDAQWALLTSILFLDSQVAYVSGQCPADTVPSSVL